ncbi:hypothetical protein C8R43DRAFT_1186231 [Mycena crocata]|nr:hypothetical protein C8R43DRAFT_1186231 [Mycena crocata]
MHPSLRPEKLSTLPISIRKYATGAASGSESDMRKVITRIMLQPEISARFLPVIFARLDPELLPGPDALDTSDLPPQLVAQFSVMFLTLGSFAVMLSVPTGTYVDLWPRVWRAIELMELYPQFLPAPETAESARVKLMTCIGKMMSDPNTSQRIHATPGVHTFFARVWAGMEISHKPETNHLAWMGLTLFMRPSDWTPSNIEEFVEGAGGSVAQLATLTIQHLHANSNPCGENPMTLGNPQITALRTLLAFVQETVPVLLSPLLAAGLTTIVTEALIPVSRASFESAEALGECLNILIAVICIQPGYAYLAKAIKAGLFGAMVALGQMFHPPPGQLRVLLCSIFPAALIYHSVVSAMTSDVLPRSEGDFVTTRLFQDWLDLIGLIKERRRLLEQYHSPDYVTKRACDNPECGLIKNASEVKRCGGCMLHHYCSVSCQVSAWKLNGHRTGCKKLQANVHSPTYAHHFLTRRDESFLRLILHRDYLAHKLDILLLQLQHMHTFPSTHFATVFDYTKGPCEIRVASLVELFGEQCAANLAVELQTNLHHVIMNDGSIDLNGVNGPELTLTPNYLMRSTSSALTNGLRRIADGLPSNTDVLKLEQLCPKLFWEVKVLSEIEIRETHG